MKTPKLVMIASILAITVLSFSISPEVNARELPKDRQSIKPTYMTLEQATQKSGLLMAMYEQIDESNLPSNSPHYTAHIVYYGADVYVRGSYKEWYIFFKMKLIYMKQHMQ